MEFNDPKDAEQEIANCLRDAISIAREGGISTIADLSGELERLGYDRPTIAAALLAWARVERGQDGAGLDDDEEEEEEDEDEDEGRR